MLTQPLPSFRWETLHNRVGQSVKYKNGIFHLLAEEKDPEKRDWFFYKWNGEAWIESTEWIGSGGSLHYYVVIDDIHRDGEKIALSPSGNLYVYTGKKWIGREKGKYGRANNSVFVGDVLYTSSTTGVWKSVNFGTHAPLRLSGTAERKAPILYGFEKCAVAVWENGHIKGYRPEDTIHETGWAEYKRGNNSLHTKATEHYLLAQRDHDLANITCLDPNTGEKLFTLPPLPWETWGSVEHNETYLGMLWRLTDFGDLHGVLHVCLNREDEGAEVFRMSRSGMWESIWRLEDLTGKTTCLTPDARWVWIEKYSYGAPDLYEFYGIPDSD